MYVNKRMHWILHISFFMFLSSFFIVYIFIAVALITFLFTNKKQINTFKMNDKILKINR